MIINEEISNLVEEAKDGKRCHVITLGAFLEGIKELVNLRTYLFQRGASQDPKSRVWSLDNRIKFIQDLFIHQNNFQFGSPIWRILTEDQRKNLDEKFLIQSMDASSRSETLLDFIKGDLYLPKFNVEYKGKIICLSGTSADIYEKYREIYDEIFLNFKISISTCYGVSDDYASKIFYDVNNNKKLTKAELRNSMPSKLNRIVRNMARENCEYGGKTTHTLMKVNENGVRPLIALSDTNYAADDYIAKAFALQCKLDDNKNRLYDETFDIAVDDALCMDYYERGIIEIKGRDLTEDIEKKVRKILSIQERFLSGLKKPKDVSVSKLYATIRLFALASQNYDLFFDSDLSEKFIARLNSRISSLSKTEETSIYFKPDKGATYTFSYHWKRADGILFTTRMLLKNFLEDVPPGLIFKDKTRMFSSEMKSIQYDLQNGLCALTGKPMSLHKLEGAHIIPHSHGIHAGGTTSLDNLLLISKFHNSQMGTQKWKDYMSTLNLKGLKGENGINKALRRESEFEGRN